jgi:CheY-like chemotaxis protein
MRVLVVDDNASSREIVQTLLENMSFEVSVAASAGEGIAELENGMEGRPYELVLMDWMMPGVDGLKASEVIRNHPGLEKKPKIIMVTAYAREEVMRRSEKMGLDGSLLKPVSQSMLFDTIMRAFRVCSSRTPLFGMLGLLSLAGVIINNGIVLIDKIDNERTQGREPYDAVVSAAISRFRPIMMTTITTILGVMPIIVSVDPLFYSLAVIIAFGLVFGTLLTLGIAPVLYAVLFRVRQEKSMG